MSSLTRDRILDGAAEAVARHGISKLDMGDVSASSGVSRPTIYRYFPRRNVLLTELARREGLRFRERMIRAIEEAPRGPDRILVALEHATRHVRDHAVLQRLLETDPGLLLRGLRLYLPFVRDDLVRVLGPLLQETEFVRRGLVTTEQLVDWLLRLMVSAFLLPDAKPDQMAQGLTAVYRLLTSPTSTRPGRSGGTHSSPARGRKAGSRRNRKPLDEVGSSNVGA